MAGIFISYRRDDAAGDTGRLSDMLISRFGRRQVFMDVDMIDPGSDFVEQLEGSLSECQVLIAVIGPRWATVQDEDGNRRLDNPDDFVRLEIAQALAAGIRVYPVLVGGARMPRPRDLPEDLQALSRRHAHELSHTRFRSDASELIEHLRPLVGDGRWGRNRLLAIGVAGLVLAAAVAAVVVLVTGRGGGTDPGTDLAMSVSPSLRSTCDGVEPTFRGSDASIACSLPGADGLVVASFPSSEALASAERSITGTLPKATEPCGRSEWSVTLPWNLGGEPLGQLSCYTDKDKGIVMSWSNETRLSVAWAERADGDRKALVQAWGTAVEGVTP
jgi:TIR domain